MRDKRVSDALDLAIQIGGLAGTLSYVANELLPDSSRPSEMTNLSFAYDCLAKLSAQLAEELSNFS